MTTSQDKRACYNPRFGQHYDTEVGRLNVHAPRTALGKKVMTWDFRPTGSDKTYEIDVTYHLDDDRMFFRAASATVDVAIEDSDIEALRRAVEARLLLASIDVQAMQWENWLAVSVSGSGSRFNDHPYTGMGAELKIHVQRLKRGWHAPTRRHVTINRNGLVTDFPQPTEFKARETLREDDMEWLVGGTKPQTAYIPETPENLAALTDIQSRLAALQDRLMALLHQEAIHDSLSGLESLLLPRPSQP